jgi:hypothetical protein
LIKTTTNLAGATAAVPTWVLVLLAFRPTI